MTPRPWADPELTSRGRLPMHAVPHDDRLPLDGAVAVPAAAPPGRGARRGVGRGRRPRLLDHAGHVGPADLHQRPDAVPRSPARDARGEPDRRLRAVVRGPRRLGRPAGRAPRGGRRERAAGRGQRAGRRDQQGLASRGRVRGHPTCSRPGANDAAADRREVVRRLVHRGPGPVVARRHHAPGVPVRDRLDLSRGPGGRRGAGGRRVDRHAVARGRRSAGPAPSPSRAGGSRPRSRADGRRWPATCARSAAAGHAGRLVRARAAAAGRRRPPEPQRRRRADRARRRRPLARGRARRPPHPGRPRPPGDRGRGRPPVVGGGAVAVPARGPARRAGRHRRRAGRAPDRVPAGGGPGRRAARQRARGPHPRREPPRLRPADRPGRRARGHARRRRRDEALGLQRRPDRRTTRTTRPSSTPATSSGCTSSTRRTSSRTAGTRTCAGTPATGPRSSTAWRG